jgi:hypothetical protein
VTTLLENPIAIAVVGALLATVALVVFLSRRTTGPLAALIGILAATGLLLLLERWVVTDREAVEYALADMLTAIEANDLPAATAFADSAEPGIKSDMEALMPQVKVQTANAGAVAVETNPHANPPTATSHFQAYLHGTHGSSGQPLAYINQRVDIEWVKRGERWLVSGYTAYYDGQPIDAVSSARGNRAMPSR